MNSKYEFKYYLNHGKLFAPTRLSNGYSYFFTDPFSSSTAAQSYCNAGPTSTLDSEITGVNLKGDTDTIANYSPNCGTVGIQNFTNMTADLTKNQSYTLEVTMGRAIYLTTVS